MSKVFCVLRNKAFKQKAKQLDISEAALDRIVFNYINQVGNADAFPPDDYIMSEYSPVNVVSREDLPYALDVWNQLFSEDQTFLSIQEAMDAMAEAQQYFKEEAAVIQPLYNGQYKVIVGKPQLPTKVPSSKVLFQKTLENQRYILASVKYPFKSWSRNINGQLALLKRKGVDDVILEQFRLALTQDPRNANLTPTALFNKIVQQKVDYIEQAYQEYFNLKAIPALEQHLENFLKKYNFEIRREDMSTLFEDGVLGAVDLLNKVIYVAKEGRNAITFPEEFAHAFVELMGAVHKSSYSKDYPTFKDYSFLFDSVEHTAIYKRVFEQYKTTYLNEQGDPDIETIKKEAIGQALAAAIVDNWKVQHEPEEKGFWAALKRLFNAILNTFKDAEYFSFDTLINKMADEIVKGDYSRLEKLDATDYSLVEYSETIRNQNSIDNGLAFGMIKDFSDNGGIITGSLSYRAQGRVYRGQMDGLHDIDMIIPQSVHGIDLNSEELKNALAACSYRNMQPLKEYLLKHDYFKQIEAKYSKALSASEQEMMDIKKKAQANGTFMLAPNGKPTNLTERQWLQVRTKAFKAWFGDWERYAPKNARNNLISTDGDINWEYFESLMDNYHNGQPDSMFSKGRYTLATRPEKHFEGEGNTLNHIKFVTQTMLDLFEGKYDMDLPFVSEARASLKNQKDLMVLAAMFHDAAKPYRHGDIHGWESADILRDVIGIDYNNRLAEWAIRHHMAMPFSHKADFVASNPEAVEVAKNMARDAMRIGIDAQTAINAFVLINSADIINNRDISVEDNWAKKAQAQGINRYGEDISVKNVLSIELNEKVDLLKQAFEAVKDEDFGDTAYNYANQERFDYIAFPEGGRKLPFLHNNESNTASKVVDENGEPLVVYHGSNSKEIQAFDLSTPNLRSFTGTLNKKFYFMDSRKDALSYINEKYETLAYAIQRYDTVGVDWEEVLGPDSDENDLIEWYAKELGVSVEDILKARELMDQYGDVVRRSEDFEDYLYPVFLNLRNPVTIDADGRQIIDLTDEEKKAVNKAQDAIIKRVNEAVYSSYVGQIVNDFLTDNPNNIKSAVSNSGEFSIQNNDIYDPIDYQGSAFRFFNVIANSTDDYITVSAVYSPYNPELARKFMSLEGSYSDRLDKFTDKERQQIYLFDFFLKANDSTPYITTEDGIRMSEYQTSFTEKLKMGRAKDVFDYQRWKTYDTYKSRKLSSKVMYQKQIQYNKEQQEAIDKMAQHIQDVVQGKTDQKFFTLQGKAGTGKTTCIDGLVKKYREQTGSMYRPLILGGALSWEATNNLKRKVSNPGRATLEFKSLASMLGMIENVDGEFVKMEGRTAPADLANLIIIDECSQITEEHLDLIEKAISGRNVAVIFAGDPGQTPPIRSKKSGVADDELSPVFTDPSIPKVQLTQRVRQGEESPLLDYADKYWNYAMGLTDEFPTNEGEKSIVTDKGALIFQRSDVDVIAQTEQLWYEGRGDDSNPIGNPYLVRIVPFRTNTDKAKKATTAVYNDRVRELFYGEKEVATGRIYNGDSIVFTTNYDQKLTNSTLAKVNRIGEPRPYELPHLFNSKTINELLDSGEIGELNLQAVMVQDATITYIGQDGKPTTATVTLIVPTAANINNFKGNISKIYNTFKSFYYSQDAALRNLAFLYKEYRDSVGQVQFAHSIGVHKAQGSTYDVSIVDANDIMSISAKNVSLRSKARAIYTALTRASNVTIVITDDTNEDTVYTDIKAINDRINQAKKGQAEGQFVPATEKAYYGKKVTKKEAKARVTDSNKSSVGTQEYTSLSAEDLKTIQGDSAGKITRKTTKKSEDAPKKKFASKKQENVYNEVVGILEEAASHIEFFGEGDDHYYEIDGKRTDYSMSEFATFLRHDGKLSKKNIGEWGTPSSTLGTGADDILRDYFMGQLKDHYPNFTESQLNRFVNESIVKFKKELERIFGKGYVVITDPEILKVAAQIEYKGTTYSVAGTMDMLVIDSKGRVNVVDFKTKRANSEEEYDQSKIDQYTLQTSLYLNSIGVDESKKGRTVIVQFNQYYPSVAKVDYARNDKIAGGKYKGVLLFREKNTKGNYYPITEISSYQDRKGKEFEYSAQDLVRDKNVGYRAAEFYEMDETKWQRLSPEDMSIQMTPYVPGTTVLAQNKQTARSTRKKSVNQEKATKTGQGVNNFAKYKNSSVQSEDFFTAVRDGEITAITKVLNGDYFASLKVGDVLELHNQNRTKSILVRITKVNDDDTLAGFSDAEWSNWDARNGISEQYYNEILDGNNNTLAEFQFKYVEGSYSEEGQEESQPETATQPTVKRQTTTEPSTTEETAIQINKKKATRGASATMDMYYNGNQRDEITSKSTLMAIVNGERTATTRHKHIEFWKKWKRGDIMELHDKAGRSILVKITKAAKALPKNISKVAIASWSKKEGWSKEYFEEKILPLLKEGQEVVQIEFQYVKDSYLSDKKPEATKAEVQKGTRKASVNSVTTTKEFNSHFTESIGDYGKRTDENAAWSDITLAMAVDFTTGGELRTAEAAGAEVNRKEKTIKPKGKYVQAGLIKGTPEDSNELIVDYSALDAFVTRTKRRKTPLKLNIAGNGIAAFKGSTQEQVNEVVYEALSYLVDKGVKIAEIRSGGQTGVDEAGIIAAQKLNIPWSVHAPKGWIFRKGIGRKTDVYDEKQFKARFLPSSQKAADKLPGPEVKMDIWAGRGQQNPELSNVAKRPFTLQLFKGEDPIEFNSVEQAFQYTKFRLLSQYLGFEETKPFLLSDQKLTGENYKDNVTTWVRRGVKAATLRNGNGLSAIGDSYEEEKEYIENHIQKILSTKDDKYDFEVKRLGGKNGGYTISGHSGDTFLNTIWSAGELVAEDVMEAAMKASFQQNEDALQRLFDTGNATLTHEKGDKEWREAMPELLMKVRKELRAETATQQQSSSNLDDLEWTKVGNRQIAIIDTDYTKETPTDNPDTDFVFTENAQAAAVVYNDTDEQQRLDDEYELWYPGDESNMFGLKLNVTSKGNQSGIRMSDDSTFNSNAYGIVVKKFQQNQQGKFVMEEGFFHDTPEDRAMFEAYNKRFFDLLDASDNEYIVFPQQMALGKSGLPLEFAKWLKSELESRYNLICEIAPAKVNGFFGLKIQGVGETVQEDEMEFVLQQRKAREAELESARPLATYKSEFFDLEFSNDENKFYTQIATVKPVMDSDTLGNTVHDQVKQLLASLPMSALIQIDSSEIHANTVLLIEALLKDKSAHMIPGEGTEVVLDSDSQAYEFAKDSKYKDLPFDKNTGTLTIPKFTLGYTQQEIKERQEMDELLDSDLFTASELRDLSKSAIFRLSAVISELQADSNAQDKYFPNKEKVDLTGMDRVELIRKIGLGNLLAAVRDVFFDFESENSEVSLDIPFEVLDKMEFIKNHWQSFIQLGYDVLARAESIAFDSKHNVKDIDYVSSYYDYTEGQTEEEVAEFYGDPLESWQVGFRSVGAFSSLSQLIKNTFYQVYKVDEQGNPVLNEFGLKESISPQELVATLLYFLKDCRTMSQMITALEERQEDTPWVGQILDKLNSSDEQFKSQFYTNFRKYFQKYAIVYMKKGVPTLKVINEKESIEQQLAEFKAKNAVYEQGDFHLRNQDGTVSRHWLGELEKIQKALSAYNSRFTSPQYKGNKFQERFTAKELENIEKQVLSLLDALNLEVPEKVMLRKALFNIERFKKLRDSLGAKGGLLGTLKNWSEKGITAWEEQGEEYNNFIQDITNILNIVFYEKDIQLDSVSYQHGKMYYSYVLPSYLSRTISSLSQEGLTAQEYGEFMKNQFKQYGFFYTEGKTGKEGKYRLGWLERLKDPKARKALKHIVSLDHLGKEYKEKSPCEYYSSLLSHYLYSKDLAYFRVPILGNKPSEEYIRFEKITDNYEVVITDWLFETLKQEADRIRAVKQRAEYAKKHPEIKIKNFDGKNGLRFNFLDFMQPYYDGTYKSTREYQEANSETRKKLDKFAKILSTYVDNTRKLTTDQQTQFPELFADVLKLCMENRFKEALKDYEDVGFVSRRNGFKVLDHKGVTEGLLREFFWNDFYASINITQILLTDIAYYKNTEDLQKRLPQVHAPGRMANIEALDIWDENDPNAEIRKYTDGYERTMYLKDRIDKADILINLDKALNNIERAIKDKEELAGFRELRKFILETFSKVNMTDAQGYSCPTSYRKKLAIFGDWTKEMETLYRKLISDEAMTGEDIAQAINVLWEPLKPFVYSQIPKPGYNSVLPTIKVGVQNKNSEYVLLLAEAIMRKGNQPNKLSAIYKFMEDSQRDENGRPTGKGIDTIQFESTVKTGLMGVIDINGLTTEEEVYNALQTAAGYNRDTDSYSKDYVHEIPFDDYIIQQNVPSHFRKHSQGEGSQVRILSISDIPFLGENNKPNTISFDFGVDGEGKPQQHTMTVQEAVEEYCALHAENIEESGQEVLRRFNIQAVDDRARNIALSRVLKQAILKDGRLGADMLWACDTNKFGEFNIPLSDPIHCSRIQQLLNSIIKNDINKQKIAGGPLVQVTSFGTSDDLQVRYKTTSGQILLTEKEFYSKNMPTDYGTNSYKNPQGYDTYEEYIEDQLGVAYFEAYVPIWDEDLIKDFSTTDVQGNTIIDVEAIRQKYPKMLEMMGYRIPTESKYSMVPIRVKGFLPINSEGIMLPAEITSFSGSDFDVDKLYVMLYKFKRVVKKMGKKSVVTYEEVTEGRDGRNNKILSIARALLASPYTARQFSTPGNFEAPKKLGYLISYVQQSDKVTVGSYNEAKGKDVDTLKDLNYKSKNLLFNNVQVQFHTQNMVAAQLIGVFALANVSHAFISLYNERCRANNSDSNKKPMEPAKIHIPDGYEFTLDGYEMSGDVIIDDMMTLDRRDMISSNLAALLASSVDAVKDPILNLININMDTVNPIIALLRLGFNLEQVSLLCSQPIIRKVINEFNFRKALAGKNKKVYLSTVISDQLSALCDKDDRLKGIYKIDLSSEDLIANLVDQNTPTSRQVAYATLKLWERATEIAKTFRNITHMTSYNSISSAVGPFAYNTAMLREKQNAYKRDSTILKGTRAAINNPILLSFMKVADNAEQLVLGGNMAQASDSFNKTFSILSEALGGYMEESTAREFTDFYMAYFTNTGPSKNVFTLSADNRGSLLFDFPKWFAVHKHEFQDNAFVRAIRYTEDDQNELPYLKLETRRYSYEQVEDLKKAWTQLFKEGGTRRDLAITLAEYCFFRGTFGFNPMTFINLLPSTIKLGLPGYVENLQNPSRELTENQKMAIVIQFLLHHKELFGRDFGAFSYYKKQVIQDLGNGRYKMSMVDPNGPKDRSLILKPGAGNLVTVFSGIPYLKVEEDPIAHTVTLQRVNFLGGEGLGIEVSTDELVPETVFASGTEADNFTGLSEEEFSNPAYNLSEKQREERLMRQTFARIYEEVKSGSSKRGSNKVIITSELTEKDAFKIVKQIINQEDVGESLTTQEIQDRAKKLYEETLKTKKEINSCG